MEAEADPSLAARVHCDCFVCAHRHDNGLKLRFASSPDGAVSADFACDGVFEGYRGVIHGGVVATLLDGAMTHCLFHAGEVAVTADLHVRYRHPLLVGRPATVRAWITRATPPLFLLSAEVAQDQIVKATAVAKFMLAGEFA